MSWRKGLKKQERNDAQKEKIIKDDNIVDMFYQFREEVRNEIEDLKEVISELRKEVHEKDKRIEELELKNDVLSERVEQKEK